jgi:hypothetical protein
MQFVSSAASLQYIAPPLPLAVFPLNVQFVNIEGPPPPNKEWSLMHIPPPLSVAVLLLNVQLINTMGQP